MNLLENIRSHSSLVIGGHRGQLLAGVRENTLASFEALNRHKISYIEVDVQLTKDQELVLYHDHDLALKTEKTGMIRDYTLEELRDICEICTVEEVIKWSKYHEMGVAFELKIHPQKMWEDRELIGKKLLTLIQKYHFHEQCFVIGADFAILKQMKQADARINLAVIVPFVPVDPVQFMREMEADIYLNYSHLLSKELVDTLHKAGYLVDGSVVNNRDQLNMAYNLGVDLVESDYPERVQIYLEELEKKE